MRQSGYYWIKRWFMEWNPIKDDHDMVAGDWEVAEWDNEQKRWSFHGDDCGIDEKEEKEDIAEIYPLPINPPTRSTSELKSKQ